MNDLQDYIKWIGQSLGVKLNEVELEKLTHFLVENKNYQNAVRDLEGIILKIKEGN